MIIENMKRNMLFAHMNAAKAYANCSYCVRLKVGAILVKGDTPIANGYNGRPSGEPNICEIDLDTTHPEVIHAEQNALKKVMRSNESSVGSMMFVTHSPCRKCAIDIVDAKVTAVFFEMTYRDDSGIIYLIEHGLEVYQLEDNKIYIYSYGHDGLNRREITGLVR